MNDTLKRFLLNFFKNFVNASLTALGPVAAWPSQFHFHSWLGVRHILLIMGSAGLAREIMVYAPIVLKWSSNTNGNGNGATK